QQVGAGKRTQNGESARVLLVNFELQGVISGVSNLHRIEITPPDLTCSPHIAILREGPQGLSQTAGERRVGARETGSDNGWIIDGQAEQIPVFKIRGINLILIE